MIRLDHVTTSTNARSIEDQVQQYRNAKFLRMPHTVPYDPGLRHAFITFGFEYLELSWIENWELFAKEAQTLGPEMFAVHPFRVAFCTDDLENFQAQLQRSNPDVAWPSIKDLRIQANSVPFAKMLVVPPNMLGDGGVTFFVFQYCTRPKTESKALYVAPNRTFAMNGVSFVSSSPLEQLQKTTRIFSASTIRMQEEHECVLQIGPHVLRWLQPETYQAQYEQMWRPSRNSQNEIAFLHVLTTDLTVTQTCLQTAGRTCHLLPDSQLFVQADPQDGTALLIREQAIEAWVANRQDKDYSVTIERL